MVEVTLSFRQILDPTVLVTEAISSRTIGDCIRHRIFIPSSPIGWLPQYPRINVAI
jgi:hypothetical protein